MRRFAGWVLAVLMAVSGVALAADKKHEDWAAVKKLDVDTDLLVQGQGQRWPDRCRLISADDNSLTCERVLDPDADWRGLPTGRVVFPKSAVRHVWVWEQAPNRHIGLWIAVAVTAAAEIAALVAGGPGGGLIVGLFLVAGWSAATTPSSPWFQPPYSPPGPRMRKRLIYQVPVTP
ncbi:MAG TPA: hypothetical protein VF865_09660 [Acidobacteriaceae bacterium]